MYAYTGKALAAPTLVVFKARLDVALGNLVFLPMAGGLKLCDLEV